MTKQSLTLQQHIDVLKLVCSLKPKRRSDFILQLKKEHVSCIAEVFSNFLKNLTSERNIIKKLKRHREAIKAVPLKRTSVKKKKILSSRVGDILFVIAINAFTALI